MPAFTRLVLLAVALAACRDPVPPPDPCLDGGGCDARTTCTAVDGVRQCSACLAGFTGTGDTACVDVDECATANGGCDARATCTNTDGARTCGACPSGFTGTGDTTCVDIDECATANGGCDARTTCTDTDGSRTCGACPPGFDGDGETGCTCPGAGLACGDTCVDATTDAEHCGECDHACSAGDPCTSGECVIDAEWAAFPVPAASTFTTTTDTVTDTSTGLVWQRALSATENLSWAGAIAKCEALMLGGASDWVLPTVAELHTLVDYGQPDPMIDAGAFPDTPVRWVWSSTPVANDATRAWYVYGGAVNFQGTGQLNGARCVRRGSAE